MYVYIGVYVCFCIKPAGRHNPFAKTLESVKKSVFTLPTIYSTLHNDTVESDR